MTRFRCHRNTSILRRVSTPVVVAIWSFAIAACDSFSTFDRLGVSIDADASVQIHYLACDYERVAAVSLFDAHDGAQEEDDELLWEIRSEDGADGGVFTVGSQPDGFVESVPLENTLPSDAPLTVAVEPQGSVGAALTFRVVDLQVGSVWAAGKPASNIDAEAFEERARASCQSAD